MIWSNIRQKLSPCLRISEHEFLAGGPTFIFLVKWVWFIKMMSYLPFDLQFRLQKPLPSCFLILLTKNERLRRSLHYISLDLTNFSHSQACAKNDNLGHGQASHAHKNKK